MALKSSAEKEKILQKFQPRNFKFLVLFNKKYFEI